MKFNFRNILFALLAGFLLVKTTNVKAEGSAEIDSLIRIAEKAPEDEKSKHYVNICWKLRNFNPASALDYGKKALKYAEKFNDTIQILKAESFIGVCFRNLSEYDSAFKYYSEGLDLATKVNAKDQIAYSHINMGNLFLYHDEYTKAKTELNQALDVAQEIQDSSILGYIYINLGRTHLSLGHIDSATTYLEECEKIRIEKHEDWDKIATTKKYLGDVSIAKKDFSSALKYYKEAISKDNEIKDIDLLSDLYGMISSAYMGLNQNDSALCYAQKCLEISNLFGIDFRIKNAYKYLGDVYAKMGNLPKAFQQYENVMAYADTFLNARKSFNMKRMEYRLEQIRRENEITILKKDQEIQKYVLLSFALISIMIVGAVIFLIVRIKKTKKINGILKAQKDEISARNEEISSQRDILQKQNKQLADQKKEITDSINYAQRIQFSMLPEEEILKNYFTDGFIYYRPKDVVSGDFFKVFYDEDYFILLAADCTGHGVPGAFMSMLGMTAFNEIVGKEGERNPAKIMNAMREMIKKTLKQNIKDEMKSQDGMDAALIIIDKKTNILYYSGAHIPFLCYRGEEEIVIKPVHNPVGVYICERPFVTEELKLQKGDKIYLASDGYQSQFGGSSDRVMKTSGYRKILKEIRSYNMSFQKKLLEDKFLSWKGDTKQTDDVLVVGLEV
ncbi:MAG: tetratricopeptide repeat protein [Bacteroidales bacterium]|nr:tetratricopeptide repeat protein [Bacteroidales bacterium]